MNVSVVHGDCLDVMRGMDDASVGAIVTDPPYGLGFMSAKWDALPPGEEWARECLRVLKPGGYMLAFGGTRTWHRLAVAIEDAGFEIRDSIAWLHGQGFPKGQAGLKPAHEPIVVARKRPVVPRTGLLQIDACRIVTNDDLARPLGHNGTMLGGCTSVEELQALAESDVMCPDLRKGRARVVLDYYERQRERLNAAGAAQQAAVGRWPANVVLDETQAHALDQQSGVSVSKPGGLSTKALGVMNDDAWVARDVPRTGHDDMGGASRFFYVAKAPKKERPVVNGVAHATVKPLTLMRWLVRLVTPPGGTVLDPFAGSGTTVEAAILEGVMVIGIERDAEYLPLIDARITRNDPTLDLGDGGAA